MRKDTRPSTAFLYYKRRKAGRGLGRGYHWYMYQTAEHASKHLFLTRWCISNIVSNKHLLVCPCKHVVDDGHELHDSLIQMEVLKAFEEVGVLAAV